MSFFLTVLFFSYLWYISGLLAVSWHQRQSLSAFGRNQSSTEPNTVRAPHWQYKSHRPQRLQWNKRWRGPGPLSARDDQVRSTGFLVQDPGRCPQRTVHLPGSWVSGCSASTQVSGTMMMMMMVSISIVCGSIDLNNQYVEGDFFNSEKKEKDGKHRGRT